MKDKWLISEYKNNGVTAKLKEGEAGWFQIKIFGKNDSFILYEGYEEDDARTAWRLLSKLIS